MTKPRFLEPDIDEDQQQLDDEKKKSYSQRFWKPIPKEENVIRILPARAEAKGKATYHLKVGKHFIKHSDGTTEAFICNRETYGEDCIACNEYMKLKKEGKTNEAKRFLVKKYGVFNVLNRDTKEIKLWESPRRSIWEKMIGLIASKGRLSNLLDRYDAKEKKWVNGRDILVYFDPDTNPQNMYSFHPDDTSPLGTEEEIESYYEQITDLEREKLYPYTDENVVEIKTFGSSQEREKLRKALAEMRKEEKEEMAGEEKEEEESEEEAEEESKEETESEEKEEKAEEKEEEEEEKPKKKEPKKGKDDDDITAKIEEMKKRRKERLAKQGK